MAAPPDPAHLLGIARSNPTFEGNSCGLPQQGDVLPLEELPAAFALSREGHVRGKPVLSVSD